MSSLISTTTPVNTNSFGQQQQISSLATTSSNQPNYATKQIKTDHKDLIQDIAFDFYGKRVATASLDQSVRIWNITENNEWIFKEELKVNKSKYLFGLFLLRLKKKLKITR